MRRERRTKRMKANRNKVCEGKESEGIKKEGKGGRFEM